MSVGGVLAWPNGLEVRYLTTERTDGDFALAGDADARARAERAVVDLPWVRVRQVHGAEVVRVTRGSEAAAWGREADALVTADEGIVLAVGTADCVPVVLASAEGVIGVAHAGWRGLEAGVIEATVAAMRAAGATAIEARLGPCIGMSCYEFGPDELERLVDRFGPSVTGRTATGTAAFDAVAAARVVLARVDVVLVEAPVDCTACAPDRWFSHRARAEAGRMVTIVWREAFPADGSGR